MKDKKLLVIIVLAVLAVVSLIYGLVAPPKSRYRSSSDSPIVSVSQGKPASGEFVSEVRAKKRTTFASWGRNPFLFQPLAGKEAKQTVLDGIIWDSREPKAVIGGEILGVGDSIGPNKIVDIKPDKVILNDGVNNIELELEL